MALSSTEASSTWCGIFTFSGGSYLYNCDTTLGLGYTVESMADWYRTAVGSTLTDGVDRSSESTEESTTILIVDSRSTATRPSGLSTLTRSLVYATSDPPRRVLSGAAIGGIAAGGAVLIFGTAAIIITWCCLRRRRKRGPQAVNAETLVPRPPAVFDPALLGMQQAPGMPGYHQIQQQPGKPYNNAFKTDHHHGHPSSPPLTYASLPSSPIQTYSELSETDRDHSLVHEVPATTTTTEA